MPRFFFHLVSPGNYSVDEVGGEFCDVETAYLDAWQAALEMSFEMLKSRTDPSRHQFEIVDEEGRFLLEIPFSDVVRPAGRPLHNDGLHTQLRQHLRRNRDLRADLQAEFCKTRQVLETAHATLERARTRN
jgi:hypothetical protein